MLLSEHSDPAVLDRHLNPSPILSLKSAERTREKEGGETDWRGDLDDLSLLLSLDLLDSRAVSQSE